MKFPRPASRGRLRYALAGGLTLIATGLVAGCDSRVGIEGTDYNTDEPPAAASTAPTTPSAAAAAAPVLPKPKPGELAVTVSLTKPDSDAADALTRWAMDLQSAAPTRLQAKCWTLAPQNVQSMYTDKKAILSALARPGMDDGTAITWQGTGRGAVTVVAQHTDIATGYACPRVFQAGTTPTFNDADARHTVRRYLDRVTGTPLDPADKETTHPLRCTAATGTWDPTGAGRTTTAPLASEPGKLDDVQSFVDQSLTSGTLRGSYVTVSASVLTTGGVEQTRTFTLKSGKQGYCIGDVSS
ncbi:hypothetical protein K7711_19775 [Nocardia sp. CA2R105]|uniref:hypothetical protein n=1 Tax=Nocardia coffeae TaxID=2873381 RepID=UPI001CA6966B|nr:hypothetical protein [Nocardia coffeae]MBY8858723.1 hypothetical protein [Nocardia coffeae]